MLAATIALLVYPGLLLALVLTAAFQGLTTGRLGLPLRAGQVLAGAATREGLLALASVLLAGTALALLPWPWSPIAGSTGWLWAWLALELAFILTLVAGLLSGDPRAARAAMRELQIGVAARGLLWPALVAGLSLGAAVGGWAVAGRLLLGFLGVLALPPALGWGPFAAETSITPAGAEEGFGPAATALAHLARATRGAVLLAVLLLAALPIALAAPWLGPLMLAAGFVVATLLLQRVADRWPRLTLRDALHYCWLRLLPVSVAVLVCFILNTL